MEDNQINGQIINKETYCPNSFFDNGTISIGEFKTLDDAMNFPIKEIWCINRTEDNKFQSYKSQGSRLFIICSWNRSTQDPLKFVLALIHKDKVGKLYYWDMNDLPLYPDEKKNQYEGSLGDDATYTLYQIANNKELNCNTNMNKKLIRLTESDLHKVIKESVNKVLTELDWKTYANAARKRLDQDEDDKAEELAYFATDRFNDDFGYDELDGTYDAFDKPFHQDVTGHIYPCGNSVSMGRWSPLRAQMHAGYYPYDTINGSHAFIPGSKKATKNVIDKYKKATDEIDKFNYGDYKYVKGKGWEER